MSYVRARYVGYGLGVAGVVVVGFLATSGQYIASGSSLTASSALTANSIPKASGGAQLANSNVSDNGTTVTIASAGTITGDAVLGDSGSRNHTFNGTVTMNNTAFIATLSVTGNGTLGNGNTDLWTVWGHSKVEGTSPTLSSCGSGPAIVGSDNAGYFTTGTGGTTCTATFSRTYTVEPSCVFHTAGAAGLPVCTVSATAITCTTTVASTKYHYICMGVTGGT